MNRFLRRKIEAEFYRYAGDVCITWIARRKNDAHADCIICYKGHYIEIMFLKTHFWEELSPAQADWLVLKQMAGAKVFVVKANRYFFELTDVYKIRLYMDSIHRVPFCFPEFINASLPRS